MRQRREPPRIEPLDPVLLEDGAHAGDEVGVVAVGWVVCGLWGGLGGIMGVGLYMARHNPIKTKRNASAPGHGCMRSVP